MPFWEPYYKDMAKARKAYDEAKAQSEEEEENIPCKKCGRTDLPLHPDYLCPDCHENERLMREELKATEGKHVPDYDPTWLRFK